MSLFKDMLKSDETLFKDEIALDYDYLPKLLPYRENEQHYLANLIKPLLQKRNGKNILIHGAPGIGKTAAVRWVLRDLENETEEVFPIYVNCWKKNTCAKIIHDVCEQMGIKFFQNKTKEELFDILKKEFNKKAVVFVLDEVDKLDDYDFLYLILEEVYRKTIVLVTNYRKWLLDLDERIRSRLTAEIREFKQYDEKETKGILKERLSYAFVPGAWDDEAFNLAAKKAAELRDIRSGLYLLKESGNAAEEQSSRKIDLDHVKKAIQKLDEYNIKKSTDLDAEVKNILDLIKSNSNKKIGDLFNMYVASGGSLSYKSFSRRIDKLKKDKFITVTKTQGGEEGNTSIIKYNNQGSAKKLTEF